MAGFYFYKKSSAQYAELSHSIIPHTPRVICGCTITWHHLQFRAQSPSSLLFHKKWPRTWCAGPGGLPKRRVWYLHGLFSLLAGLLDHGWSPVSLYKQCSIRHKRYTPGDPGKKKRDVIHEAQPLMIIHIYKNSAILTLLTICIYLSH